MSAHTEPQIITQDGKPAFAVIPWEEYQELTNAKNVEGPDVWFPHEVVEATAVRGDSLIKAWREFRGLTQEALAQKTGMAQASIARLENSSGTHRESTLAKLAAALDITPDQLRD